MPARCGSHIAIAATLHITNRRALEKTCASQALALPPASSRRLIGKCLREHPAVEDAAVTGAADDDLGERVVAWIVLRDGASAQESELIDDVAGHLARPSAAVRFLDELPRNDMGKVQKQRPGA
jgi:hypothetical protein